MNTLQNVKDSFLDSKNHSNPTQSARETLATVGEKMSDGYQVAKEEIKKASSQLETIVKQNPFTSVAAAAGLGWAVGRLLRPKHKADT